MAKLTLDLIYLLATCRKCHLNSLHIPRFSFLSKYARINCFNPDFLLINNLKCQTIWISDEAPHFVGPHLDPNCLQILPQVGKEYNKTCYRLLPVTYELQRDFPGDLQPNKGICCLLDLCLDYPRFNKGNQLSKIIKQCNKKVWRETMQTEKDINFVGG